ncbi:uncharacterized protein H6S33_003843 [Morchella sextelata]|uniref:uncharacterized protein n=1 Tax=Morchella sextelata TaxID=1174677 RepID=UPI001D042578|nr:uncharacterized protein H6S33_003843 [Morchella sextelata]KAH0606182.1 hypothetical protein H6S33_003843 [Morchella sextelata]
MPKFTNPTLMHTKTGALKSPPYLQGQKKADCVKSPHLADIITKQFTPFLARQAAGQTASQATGQSASQSADQSAGQAADQSTKPKKTQSDRELERDINKWMCLSKGMKATCEEAKANGAKSFKIFKGKIGSIIEVFFDVDISQHLNKVGTLVNKGLEEINKAALTYEQVEVPAVPGAFYLALDKNYTRMFVYFSKGFEMVYGVEIGDWVLKSTTYNIEEYAELQPPDIPGAKDIRHAEYKNWLLANPHLCWADWSRAGVYHWGMWMERGHDNDDVITKDTLKTSQHMNPVLLRLFTSLGNLTRAKRILLGAVDKDNRDLCVKMITALSKKEKQQWVTDDQECFSLRACLINLFTEPHYNIGDLKDGWAVMAAMGEFTGADFCIREMNRKFVCRPGGIGFIRGTKLEHFTTNWYGFRHCLVSTMHQAVKEEYFKRFPKIV